MRRLSAVHPGSAVPSSFPKTFIEAYCRAIIGEAGRSRRADIHEPLLSRLRSVHLVAAAHLVAVLQLVAAVDQRRCAAAATFAGREDVARILLLDELYGLGSVVLVLAVMVVIVVRMMFLLSAFQFAVDVHTLNFGHQARTSRGSV